MVPVIFPFETNLHLIQLTILGCLGDQDNALISKWQLKKQDVFVKHKCPK